MCLNFTFQPYAFFTACLHVACVVQQKDARQWFAELSVDMEKVVTFYLMITDLLKVTCLNWYIIMLLNKMGKMKAYVRLAQHPLMKN